MRTYLLLLVSVLSVLLACCRNQQIAGSAVQEKGSIEEKGKDSETGLVLDEHFLLVKSQCTACHSAKLITMNRFTREGWKDKIAWMQKTQNLWDLGENETLILDYLTRNYSPEEKTSRRRNLEGIEWYKLP